MKRRRMAWLVTGAYWGALFAATHLPVPSTGTAGISDKVAHFAAYLLLAGMLYLSIWLYMPALRGIGWIVLIVTAIYGVIDELLQIPVGRSCELADWVANMLGAGAMVLLIVTCRSLRDRIRLWRRRTKDEIDAKQSSACSVAD